MPEPLPPDIIFEILGHLSVKDMKDAQTLRSASLVSSFCHRFCQKALFSHLLLRRGLGDGANPSRRLLDVFKSSPFLATHVQSLVIREEDSWVQSDSQLPQLLEFLLDASASITEFSCLLHRNACWQDYPERTQSSIVALCTLPRLSRLSLAEVPLEALRFFGLHNLERFWVFNRRNPDRPSQAVIPRGEQSGLPARIDDLLLSDQDVVRYIVEDKNGLDLRTLKVLSVAPAPWVWWDASISLAPLFDLCKTSLVELHLRSRDCTYPHLTELVNLKVITVSASGDSGNLHLWDSITYVFRLPQMLQTLPLHNALQVLQIGEWRNIVPSPTQLKEVLGELNGILSSPRFSTLERLTVLVSGRPEDKEGLVQLLPKLQQHQILHVVGKEENAVDMLLPFAETRVNSLFNS
ncbi:hypothetical protein BKA70DRAFT_1565011 [Coprinopsis sp. MPI-PUGE-AT-0042]|nr:hypothetical protein BKA70DRAFT_1565011 [Coprinopsis sp. MPI-PUGE-AT-0042]